jgi:hypothetical protein
MNSVSIPSRPAVLAAAATAAMSREDAIVSAVCSSIGRP